MHELTAHAVTMGILTIILIVGILLSGACDQDKQ
jgi:hypothetical protein